MEFNQKLKDLLDSDELVNIKLAYTLFVESGQISFIDFIRHGWGIKYARSRIYVGELTFDVSWEATPGSPCNQNKMRPYLNYRIEHAEVCLASIYSDVTYGRISTLFYKLTGCTRTHKDFKTYFEFFQGIIFLELLQDNSDEIEVVFKKWIDEK